MEQTDSHTSSQNELRVELEPPSERSFAQASNALAFVNRSLPAVANFVLRLKGKCLSKAK